MSSATDTTMSGTTGTTNGADELADGYARATGRPAARPWIGAPGNPDGPPERLGRAEPGDSPPPPPAVAPVAEPDVARALDMLAPARRPCPSVVVLDAALTPPPSTSPQWYWRGRDGS